MKNIIILSLIFTGLMASEKYEVTHIKRGGALNVRDVPQMSISEVIGKIAYNTTGISIKECAELEDGSEWCYINVPKGASHIEGWVSSYYLKEMTEKSTTSKAHIKNFLQNFYMAEEENYLDKLQVFYQFPMQKYLWNQNLSLRDLRIQKVREYKKWPKRDLRFTYVKILKRKENYIDVHATVRWSFSNGDEYENGKDIQKLRLVPVGNTFKVSALKNLTHIVFPKPKIVLEENLTDLTEEYQPVVLTNKFYIKAGSFFSNISENYLAVIKKNGFLYSIQQVKQDNKVVRRVFIGPFDSMDKAKEALVIVRAKINEFAYIQSNIR